MPLAETLYAAAVRAARPVLPLLARGDGKLARGIRGRRGVLERIEAWAQGHRDPSRPLAWFHAPSVGEGHQAKAVVERFRARRPDAQVVYTFFSPSAERFARTVPADFADYLPLDAPADVRRALDALRPDVSACSSSPPRSRPAPGASAAPRARCWPPPTGAWTPSPPSRPATRSASPRWASPRSAAR